MRSLLKNKKGFTLGDLQGIVLLLVVIGILFGAGLYVMTEFYDQIDDGTHNTSLSAISNVTNATESLASWLPIIVVVIAAALVIGIVIRSFGGAVS